MRSTPARRAWISISPGNRDRRSSSRRRWRGMTLAEFNDNFMSLGGSPKFGDTDTFGRIGIGSLALLQYGQAATVETKSAASADWTVARVAHPWQMDLGGRRGVLGDFAAGWATVAPFGGDSGEHFTRLCVHDVRNEVRRLAGDPVAVYELLEQLRRVLPLAWSDCRLVEALRKVDPETADLLAQHASEWAIDVVVHSLWSATSPLPVVSTVRGKAMNGGAACRAWFRRAFVFTSQPDPDR